MRSLIDSFKYAGNGIKFCVKNERNFRIHLTAVFYVLFFAGAGRLRPYEVAILVICFAVVVIPEMINTSIETLSDIVTREENEKIKIIKDIAAGAVCVGAVCAAAVGGIIFIRGGAVYNIYETITDMPAVGIIAAVLLIPAVIFIRGKK